MTPVWRTHVDAFRTPSSARAAFEVASTVGAALVLWPLMLTAWEHAPWLVPPLVLAYAGVLVRLFVLQHDCSHGALFVTRRQNDVLGMVLCVPLLTPYFEWQKSHALHHMSSSHLDRRARGDVETMTVDEWRAASPRARWRYRAMRNPFVLFVVAPIVVFLFKHRIKGSLCVGLPRGRNLWNVQLTTLAAAALLLGLAQLVGWQKTLVLHGVALWIAGAIGVWLFFIQHQFEHTWWGDRTTYDYTKAGLQGSSFYDLHPVLHWFTGNIGFHHIHHLDPRVPLYRLPACHAAGAATVFAGVPTLTLASSLASVHLKLWNGERLVSFADAEAPAAGRVAQPLRITAGAAADAQRAACEALAQPVSQRIRMR